MSRNGTKRGHHSRGSDVTFRNELADERFAHPSRVVLHVSVHSSRMPEAYGTVHATCMEVKRVLLADDDQCTREVVAEVLRDMGLEVLTSDDGGRMLVAIASQYKSGNTPDEVELIETIGM